MIRNIILDLCAPIITIDTSLIDRAFHRHGVTYPHPYALLQAHKVCDTFERNAMTRESFYHQVRTLLNCSLDDTTIDDCWNTLITSFPKENMALLLRLSTRYNLFLLSNSDCINAHFFTRYLNAQAAEYIRESSPTTLPDDLRIFNHQTFLDNCFQRLYFSYSVGCRKPNAEIFNHIIHEQGLKVSETLFIDDSAEHIQGGKGVGLLTHQLMPSERLPQLFDNALNFIGEQS